MDAHRLFAAILFAKRQQSGFLPPDGAIQPIDKNSPEKMFIMIHSLMHT
jgi:hypothetical protein